MNNTPELGNGFSEKYFFWCSALPILKAKSEKASTWAQLLDSENAQSTVIDSYVHFV